MSSSKSWLLASLGALLLLGWWVRSSNESTSSAVEASTLAPDAAPPESSVSTMPAEPVPLLATDDPSRPSASRVEEGFALLVLDEARRPLEGARLVAQLDDGRTRAGQTAKYVQRRDQAATRELGTSGVEGRVVLEAPPLLPDGAAAWVVHGECLPRRLGTTEAASWPSEVVLRRAPLVEYLVRDASGLPVAGARVRVAPRPRGTGQTRGTTPGVPQGTVTDARGLARLPRQEPGTVAWAELDELASAPRPVADDETRVELALAPTFTLHGSVRFPTGAELSRATVVARTFGELYHDHGGIEVRDDGEFGPVRIPVVAGDGFSVLVDAMKHWAECLVLTPPPVAGAVVRHDFVLEPAMGLFVTVVDARQAPVVGALVKTRNKQGAHYISTEGVTDDQGKIVLRGSAPGELHVTVEAQGHALFTGSFHQDKSGYSTTLQLEPGWSLSGQVLADGAPVEEYILQWRSEGARLGMHRLVQGARNGGFHLPSLADSIVAIAASRSDGWRSEWVEARPPSAGGSGEVRLELQPPKPERVRVVDADTRAPIAAARIEVWAKSGVHVVGATDEVALTDAAGEALVRGWRDEATWLSVSAPGYSNFEGGGARDAQGELAPLAMRRTASLLVEVQGWENLPEPRWVHLPDMPGIREPLVDGRCLLEGLYPGWERVVVFAGDEGRHLMQRVRLEPGVQARQAWDLRGLEPLRLRLEADGSERRFGLVMAESGGHQDWVHARPGIDECLLWRRGAPVTLEVQTHDSRPFLRVVLDEQDLRADPVVVRLPKERRRLLLVDEADAPLAIDRSFACDLAASGPCKGWNAVERGVVDMHHAPGARLVCEAVVHGRELWSWSEFAFEPDPEGVQRLRAPPACTVDLLAQDEGFAVEGASVEVRSITTGNALLSIALDARGGGSFRATRGAALELRWSGEGLWPGRLEARAAEGRVALPVRRTGSLDLELRRAGALLGGESLELVDVESGARVAAWIASGAWRGDLRADADGVLRLRGLPRGRYRWRLPDSAGGQAEGECRVVAGGLSRATLSTP